LNKIFLLSLGLFNQLIYILSRLSPEVIQILGYLLAVVEEAVIFRSSVGVHCCLEFN
jgi:hypothetical protein